jgi:hypothetical protein
VYFSVTIKNASYFIIVAAVSAMSAKSFCDGQSMKNSRAHACSETVVHFAFLRWIIVPYKVLVHVNTSNEVNLPRRAEIR